LSRIVDECKPLLAAGGGGGSGELSVLVLVGRARYGVVICVILVCVYYAPHFWKYVATFYAEQHGMNPPLGSLDYDL
jgi:hypothetical protein